MADATQESGTLNVNTNGMHGKAPAQDIPSSEPNIQQVNLARTILEPINHGFASASRKALELGVPAHAVIEMQLNHLASVVAQLEPAGLRLQVIEDVVRQLGSLVKNHVDAKNRTPGGIILPRGGL